MKTIQKRPIEKYFETHDPKYIAEDAVFINMASEELTVGREAIANMLHHIYHVAFDAHAEITNTIVTKNKALLEANFIGKHIGEFAEVPATGKTVKAPLCVSYDLENDLIKTARVYLPPQAMIEQIKKLI